MKGHVRVWLYCAPDGRTWRPPAQDAATLLAIGAVREEVYLPALADLAPGAMPPLDMPFVRRVYRRREFAATFDLAAPVGRAALVESALQEAEAHWRRKCLAAGQAEAPQAGSQRAGQRGEGEEEQP